MPNYSTSDPRKIAAQQRQVIGEQGDLLTRQARQRAQQEEIARQNTQDYLGGIADPLARGLGGYNSEELSQIRMTPEEQQRMVTGAGITAGTGTAASVGAGQRAAAAAGGNPLALAAYRARAARTQGAQAGDAMTQARIAASNAAAGRAMNIGQARIGQQNTGLNYYQGLQNQQNQNAQNEYNRQQQTYSTQTSGGNQAAQLGIQASQTPSTFDKVMGGVSTAASFLEEGDVSTGTTPAVVGENGPEKVVQLRDNDANYSYMQDGGIAAPSLAVAPHTADYLAMTGAPSSGTTAINPDGSLSFSPGGAPPAQQSPSFWSQLGNAVKSRLLNPSAATAPTRPMTSFLADGGVGFQSKERVRAAAPQGANGVFTSPTRVNLQRNEAVVPLNYRASAKVRPSLAALPAAESRTRGAYRA